MKVHWSPWLIPILHYKHASRAIIALITYYAENITSLIDWFVNQINQLFDLYGNKRSLGIAFRLLFNLSFEFLVGHFPAPVPSFLHSWEQLKKLLSQTKVNWLKFLYSCHILETDQWHTFFSRLDFDLQVWKDGKKLINITNCKLSI